MFFLGFAGLPRRVHDFPAIFMGWQGLATCGQFLSLIGVS
jgi:heme/copper-type cytochrome/quinol oxidase subunit 1